MELLHYPFNAFMYYGQNYMKQALRNLIESGYTLTQPPQNEDFDLQYHYIRLIRADHRKNSTVLIILGRLQASLQLLLKTLFKKLFI